MDIILQDSDAMAMKWWISYHVWSFSGVLTTHSHGLQGKIRGGSVTQPTQSRHNVAVLDKFTTFTPFWWHPETLEIKKIDISGELFACKYEFNFEI